MLQWKQVIQHTTVPFTLYSSVFGSVSQIVCICSFSVHMNHSNCAFGLSLKFSSVYIQSFSSTCSLPLLWRISKQRRRKSDNVKYKTIFKRTTPLLWKTRLSLVDGTSFDISNPNPEVLLWITCLAAWYYRHGRSMSGNS